MANKQLFSAVGGLRLPRTDARNKAGGKAYAFSPRHALAQFAVTGCLNITYYARAEEQFLEIANAALRVEPEFVAKAALLWHVPA
jgi:60 kDa SS-A/Ro ribonucleoprotein